jgi:hypothetical protein
MVHCTCKANTDKEQDMTEYATLREKIAAEKIERVALQEKWVAITEQAHAAGMAAVEALDVVPMIVEETNVLTGAPLPGGKEWYVADGVCGFAWVRFSAKQGEGKKFLNWLVGTAKPQRADLAPPPIKLRKGYYGGYEFNIFAFNQSMQRKEAYAQAYAQVVRQIDGLSAYGQSRMD